MFRESLFFRASSGLRTMQDCRPLKCSHQLCPSAEQRIYCDHQTLALICPLTVQCSSEKIQYSLFQDLLLARLQSPKVSVKVVSHWILLVFLQLSGCFGHFYILTSSFEVSRLVYRNWVCCIFSLNLVVDCLSMQSCCLLVTIP